PIRAALPARSARQSMHYPSESPRVFPKVFGQLCAGWQYFYSDSHHALSTRSLQMGVSIVGWSHLPFGRLDGLSLEDLITRSGQEALAHAGIGGDAVDGVWLGNLNGGFTPDVFASSLALHCDPGLRWKPATRLENACASGSAAGYAACAAIAAGRARVALVIGAEKMTAVSGAETTRILGDCGYVGEAGNPPGGFPGIFASVAKDYFAEHGDHSATLARIAAKNHAN